MMIRLGRSIRRVLPRVPEKIFNPRIMRASHLGPQLLSPITQILSLWATMHKYLSSVLVTSLDCRNLITKRQAHSPMVLLRALVHLENSRLTVSLRNYPLVSIKAVSGLLMVSKVLKLRPPSITHSNKRSSISREALIKADFHREGKLGGLGSMVVRNSKWAGVRAPCTGKLAVTII
jgi:hypothetical protein